MLKMTIVSIFLMATLARFFCENFCQKETLADNSIANTLMANVKKDKNRSALFELSLLFLTRLFYKSREFFVVEMYFVFCLKSINNL